MSSTTPFDCEPTQIWPPRPPPLGRYYDLESVDAVYLVVPPAVQAFVYGVYTILFCQCMYIFRKRQPSGSHKIILTGTIILFLLCTVQCALNLIPQGVFGFSALTINMCYITNNLAAEILLIYRCHVIWGYRKSILYVPLLLSIGSTGFGGYLVVSSLPFGESSIPGLRQAPLFISLAMNVGLTLLSAGRIWWISRRLKVLGPQASHKYNTVIALIVESGAMYCVAMIAYLISIKDHRIEFMTSETISAAFFGILTQVVGILPTLIVVRIGLGISAEDA